ncbi:polyketide cyclase, partial [candidate division KSB1 bacterium]
MFKKILIGLAVIVVALLGYAATKPDTFRVERSASIKAAPETIFAQLNDFRSWGNWSPWEKLDPALQRMYSGAAVGTGAVYEWKGNGEVGAGRMEILESSPASKLNIKLSFTEPFEAQSTSEFSLTPEGETTKITWVMQGP